MGLSPSPSPWLRAACVGPWQAELAALGAVGALLASVFVAYPAVFQVQFEGVEEQVTATLGVYTALRAGIAATGLTLHLASALFLDGA